MIEINKRELGMLLSIVFVIIITLSLVSANFTLIDKRVTIQPVQIRNLANTTIANPNLVMYEDFADKIWSQAGIDVSFLPVMYFYNDTFADGVRTGMPVGPTDFQGMSQLSGYPWSSSNPNMTNIVKMFFVRDINDANNIHGLSLESDAYEGLGIVINQQWSFCIANSGVGYNETFNNYSAGYKDVIAHELGHILGIDHANLGAGAANNLMSEPHTSPTTLGNVYPHGSNLTRLTGVINGGDWDTYQIDRVRIMTAAVNLSASDKFYYSSAPNIITLAPANNTNITTNTTSFNVTFSEDYMLKNYTLFVWNSTNSIINQTTANINGTSNYSNISVTLPYYGSFIWNYQVCDQSYICVLNSTNRTITYSSGVDTIKPTFTITSPLNQTYLSNNITINFSASDSSNISAIWFNNGTTNITYTNATTIKVPKGTRTFTFYANDTIGNVNSTSVTFYNYDWKWIDKRITIQPIQVRSTDGITSISNPNLTLYEDFTDKIYSQAGVDIKFNDWIIFNNSTFLNIASSTGQVPNELAVLWQTAGHPWSLNGNISNMVIRMFFVPLIDGSSSNLGYTLQSSVNAGLGDTIIFTSTHVFSSIADNAFTLNRTDVIAHELGHNLALNHATLGAGGTLNLMSSPRTVPLLLSNVYPDGTAADQLTGEIHSGSDNWQTEQIDRIRMMPHVTNLSISEQYYQSLPPNVLLLAPANNTNITTNVTSFNATFTEDFMLKNYTLFVWNSTSSIINQTTANINGTSNYSNISVTLPYTDVFTWNYQVCDQSYICVLNSTNRTITYLSGLETVAPSMFVFSPINITYIRNMIPINFNATDLSGISALWYYNGTANVSYTSPVNISLPQGNYMFVFYANDTLGNVNSVTRPFKVRLDAPNITYFIGNSTNLSEIEDFNNVSNFRLEVPEYGKIRWNNPVNLTFANIDLKINISGNRIFINSSALHQSINSSAELTLYNISFQNPVVLRENVVCDDCNIINYNGFNFTFNVSHFSSYTVIEGANLTIWDDTNDIEGLNITHYINSSIKFYANLTNTTDPINSVDDWCTFSENSSGIWSSETDMSFNSTSNLYEINTSVVLPGTYYFNITCNASNYSSVLISTIDDFEVSEQTLCDVGENYSIIDPTTISACNCSQTPVQNAINAASNGHTVLIPAGSCVWGDSASYIRVNKTITLQGAGQGQTIINLSSTAGTYTSATIRITSPATVRSMTINGVTTAATAISASTSDWWRVTDIDYNGGTGDAYFLYAGNVYGIIDGNNISGNSGSAELIFTRGPTDSWQTLSSVGGNDNLFIENNTFGGTGYVTDANSNSRMVVRYNTITGNMKVDGHGKASNTPARGVRHMEIYENNWTSNSSFWTAIEVRGGTGTIFNNRANVTGSGAWFYLTDYGYTAAWSNFGNVCQCPVDYPVDDQIGVGQDAKIAGSEPLYLWNNTKVGSPWPLSWKSTSSCTATCGTFTLEEVIQNGIDYMNETVKPNYVAFDYPHPLVSGIPGVSLISPVFGNSTNETQWIFNISIVDSGNLSNLTLYGNWSGSWIAVNTTNVTGTYNETSFSMNNLPIGNYSWNVYGCDIDSNCDWGNLNYTFLILETFDLDSPVVALVAPENNTNIAINETSFNATFTDNVQLSNATLYVWNSTDSIINQTTYSNTGTSNYSNVSVMLPYEDIFKWNYLVFDNSSNSAWANENYTITYSIPDNNSPIINVISPNYTRYYNQTVNFLISSDETLSSCILSLDNWANNYTMSLNSSSNGANYSNTILTNYTYYAFNSSFWCNDTSGNINNTVQRKFEVTNAPICGNNIVEPGEVCDGNALNGFLCTNVSVGFTSGSLGCNSNCRNYNVASCVRGGTNITAASCNASDVQSAINSASAGDNVNVPRGECTWVYSSGTAPVVLNKSIGLFGAGINITNITITNISSSTSVALSVSMGTTYSPFRISGFTFKGGGNLSYISVSNSRNFRIDHISNIIEPYNNNPPRLIYTTGYTYGLIDHVSYDNSLATGGILVRSEDAAANINGTGNGAWRRPLSLGSAEAVYIEDSFIWSNGTSLNFATDADNGGRIVLRYNLLENVEFGSHGAQSSGGRGIFSFEVYNNTFNVNNTGYIIPVWARGGTGVIYNNTFSGRIHSGYPIAIDNPRSHTTYSTFVTYGARCNGTMSSWDGNQDATGYPCLDQIGRSTGDPRDQISIPLYEWNNKYYNGSDLNITVINTPSETQIIKDRDYYDNLAMEGYTPFVYPHFLTTIDAVSQSESGDDSEDSESSGGSSGGGGGGGGGGAATTTATAKTYSLDARATFEGHSQKLKKSDKIEFLVVNLNYLHQNYNNLESHTLTVDEVSNGSVDITIRSEPIKLTLRLGEGRKLSITSSEFYDLYVELKSINNGNAELYVKAIEEEISGTVEAVDNNVNENRSKDNTNRIFQFGIWIKLIIGFVSLLILFGAYRTIRNYKFESIKTNRIEMHKEFYSSNISPRPFGESLSQEDLKRIKEGNG